MSFFTGKGRASLATHSLISSKKMLLEKIMREQAIKKAGVLQHSRL